MLESYRQDENVAGRYKKTEARGGVAAIMQDHSNQYGPSHQAFESWKRSGIPTAEVMQPSSFGLATVKGDTAGDCFASRPTVPPPRPQHSFKPQPRPNPITWQGGPPEPAPRQRHVDPRSGRPMIEALPVEPPPPAPPKPEPPLSPDEMRETWSYLMRSGKVKPSAAQCLVDMPPDYSYERRPPKPPILSQAMNTIGLHPQDGGRPVRRSAAFTSDFRDPFM